jgi:hypothetical protein
MKLKNRVLHIVALLLFVIFIPQCGGLPIGKVSEEAGRAEIGKGPPPGYAIVQEVSIITETVWTLDKKGKERRKARRKVGVKIVAHYNVRGRSGDEVLMNIALESVEDLLGGKFIPSKLFQFHPPKEFLLRVNLLKGKIDFMDFNDRFDIWSRKIERSSSWGISISGGDLDRYRENLRDAVGAPLDRFFGRRLDLGKSSVIREMVLPPMSRETLWEKPIQVERKEVMKGVMEGPDRRLALMEGQVQSTSSTFGADIVKRGMNVFQEDRSEVTSVEAEMASKYRARVDTSSGWVVENFQRVRGIVMGELKNGSIKEDLYIKIVINEI